MVRRKEFESVYFGDAHKVGDWQLHFVKMTYSLSSWECVSCAKSFLRNSKRFNIMSVEGRTVPFCFPCLLRFLSVLRNDLKFVEQDRLAEYKMVKRL